LRGAISQHGAGLVAGDPNARNALAGFDPGMVMQADSHRQGMQHNEQKMQLAFQQASQKAVELSSKLSAEQRAGFEAEASRFIEMLASAQTPEQFQQIMALEGAAGAIEYFTGGLPPTWENRGVIISAGLGAVEAMKLSGQPEETTSFRTLHERAIAAGLQPGSEGYQQMMREGSAPQTNVTLNNMAPTPMGLLRPGERYNPETNAIEEVRGGQAERERIAQEREEHAYGRFISNQIGPLLRDTRSALAQIDSGEIPETVVARAGGKYLPWSGAWRLERLLSTVKNSMSALNLVELKKTGATVGSVPQSQWEALGQLAGYLDQDIDLPTLRLALKDIQETARETLSYVPEGAMGGVARRELEALIAATEAAAPPPTQAPTPPPAQQPAPSVPMSQAPGAAQAGTPQQQGDIMRMGMDDLLSMDINTMTDAQIRDYNRRMEALLNGR